MTEPRFANGRFLKYPLAWLIRFGILRYNSRAWLACHPLPEDHVIVGKVPFRDCHYHCHEMWAPWCRAALWLDDHKWDLDALALRLGLKIGLEGDWYVNAHWRGLH